MSRKNVFGFPPGWIEVICGPMFSGKSEELIKKINRLTYANIRYLVFKPTIDSRSNKKIVSRNGFKIDAIEIDDVFKIYDFVRNQSVQVVAMDEVQFFSSDIIEIVQVLADNGINVILAGLDKDFRGEPFGPIPQLLTVAEYVEKLTAICSECGSEATRTQRLINNIPADYNSPTILIGNNEFYTARCRHHHVVPNRPFKQISNQFKLNLTTNEIKERNKKININKRPV